MKISELKDRTGVALSTLKYYQREGLVPDGTRRNASQVDYDETHVQRVRLIRALLETGGLTIAAVKDVLRTLDDNAAPLAETFRAAQSALAGKRSPGGELPQWTGARARITQLAHARGWCVSDDNPGLDVAAAALTGMHAIDHDPSQAYLDAYADAAETAARADLHALSPLPTRDRIAELMVVGTVLGDPLFAGLRRLAQQDATKHVFPINPQPDDGHTP